MQPLWGSVDPRDRMLVAIPLFEGGISFGEPVAKPARSLLVGFSILSIHFYINASNLEKGRGPKIYRYWGVYLLFNDYDKKIRKG